MHRPKARASTHVAAKTAFFDISFWRNPMVPKTQIVISEHVPCQEIVFQNQRRIY
jgi:hypothetical protein